MSACAHITLRTHKISSRIKKWACKINGNFEREKDREREREREIKPILILLFCVVVSSASSYCPVSADGTSFVVDRSQRCNVAWK